MAILSNTPGPDCELAIRIKFKTLSQFQRDYDEQLKQGTYFLRTKKKKPLQTRVQLIFILESQDQEVWTWGKIEHVVSKKESQVNNTVRGIRIRLHDMGPQRRSELEGLFGSQRNTGESPKVNYGQSQFSRTRELEERIQDMLRMSLTANHYTMLGVKPDATLDEIDVAYQKRVREFHPDQYFRQVPEHVMENLQSLFTKLQRSYQTISDNDRRATYDVSINNYANPSALKQAQTHMKLKRAFAHAYEKQVLTPRKEKLESLEKAAEIDFSLGNYRGAFNKYKLASHLDPLNSSYKKQLQNLESLIQDDQL